MKPKQTKQTIRIFFSHSARYPWAAFLVIVPILGASALELIRPFYYRELINGLSSSASVHTLTATIITIFGLNMLGWLCYRISIGADNFWVSHVIANLMDTCFDRLHAHSYDFFNNSFGGSLVRRVNRFYRAYETLAEDITWNVLPTAVKTLSIITILYLQYWVLGVIVAVWTVVYIGFNYAFALYKMRYDLAHAEADSAASAYLSDTVTNHINLKLFGGRARERKSFAVLTQNMARLKKLSWDLDSISQAVQGFLMVGLEFGIMYAAILYWQQGRITAGDFILYQTYLTQLGDSLWNVSRIIRRTYESLADANEMTEIIGKPIGVVDCPSAATLHVTKGDIRFSSVGFSYLNERTVLSDFSLHIKPAERVALIGPSGGGKSTITKLLLRLFDIQAGKITIDGQDIATVTQESLWDAISMVPQEPLLFHRPLMENIRYARPDASDEEVYAAAAAAHCHEFIGRLPDGYATHVGERGVKLSGGERQRVAIARAILKNAPILILDEATSSLDSESERYIQDALATLMTGKTVVVIAHRLSTIRKMDRIYVLENGGITEEGTHRDLLDHEEGTYRRLWRIQAGDFAA